MEHCIALLCLGIAAASVLPLERTQEGIPISEFQEGLTQTVKFDFCQVKMLKGWSEINSKPQCREKGEDRQETIFTRPPPRTSSTGPRIEFTRPRIEFIEPKIKFTEGVTPNPCSPGTCHPLLLTLENPEKGDEGPLVLNTKVAGDWRSRIVQIKVIKKGARNDTHTPKTESDPGSLIGAGKIEYRTVENIMERMEMETGASPDNWWLTWVIYTARTTYPANCLACAQGRPQLGTVPHRTDPAEDPGGFKCLLQLYNGLTPKPGESCYNVSVTHPEVEPTLAPPSFSSEPGKYPCVSRRGGKWVGENMYCVTTHNLTTAGEKWLEVSLNNQTTPRADVWWWCGGRRLYAKLPPDWSGTCSLIQLVMPFKILFTGDEQLKLMYQEKGSKRSKRSLPKGSFDRHVYLDAIGIPRGVPDEFKARDQVATGFESILWWVTINKNVDWINYLYYNQQRFVNYTRDAIEGLHQQLDKTSLMTYQNRIALDMLLAESGGVCARFGEMCCVFIPNNTAPDGSVTRALEGLRTLSIELKENSGVDNPWGNWFEQQFGRYAAWITSCLTSIAIFAAILVTCGCCCIPCIRGLINRLITKAIDGRAEVKEQYTMLNLTEEGDVYYNQNGDEGQVIIDMEQARQ